uniref:Oocyte-expressed protein homolog n=1 Tax=Felis catus TaxID=9685 RepID=A0ABI7XKW6_FELCA
ARTTEEAGPGTRPAWGAGWIGVSGVERPHWPPLSDPLTEDRLHQPRLEVNSLRTLQLYERRKPLRSGHAAVGLAASGREAANQEGQGVGGSRIPYIERVSKVMLELKVLESSGLAEVVVYGSYLYKLRAKWMLQSMAEWHRQRQERGMLKLEDAMKALHLGPWMK